FPEAPENRRLKFFCNGAGALWTLVVNANQLHAAEFPVYARVIPPKFSRAHDGDTDFSCFGHRAHSLLIPLVASFGSAKADGGKAWMAIPSESANSISLVLSNRSVRPASTARALAPT